MALLAQLNDGVVATRFEIEKESLTIGRHPSNIVYIDDDAVSGRHAVITRKPNPDFSQFSEYYLQDLDSTNGTFINDEKVSGTARLHHNDIVRIAWNKFKFIDEQEADLERTRHMVSGD